MERRNYFKLVPIAVAYTLGCLMVGSGIAEYFIRMHDLLKPYGLNMIVEMLVTFLPFVLLGSLLIAAVLQWRARP
jgi:branched-subunit amino acid transport protein